MRGLLIPPDPTQPIQQVEATGWESMRDLIGGRCRYIERVRCRLTQPHLGNLVLVIDEEGLYHDVEVNLRATAMYNPGWRPPGDAGAIVGPALMFRETMAGLDGADFVSIQDGDERVVESYLSAVLA